MIYKKSFKLIDLRRLLVYKMDITVEIFHFSHIKHNHSLMHTFTHPPKQIHTQTCTQNNTQFISNIPVGCFKSNTIKQNNRSFLCHTVTIVMPTPIYNSSLIDHNHFIFPSLTSSPIKLTITQASPTLHS